MVTSSGQRDFAFLLAKIENAQQYFESKYKMWCSCNILYLVQSTALQELCLGLFLLIINNTFWIFKMYEKKTCAIQLEGQSVYVLLTTVLFSQTKGN